MGQADGAGIASPKLRTLRQKITEHLRGTRPGATLEQRSGQAVDGGSNPKVPASFTPMGMCGLSWKTDRSTSALCGAGATLFCGATDRLLGQCDGWTALFHVRLRGPGLLSVLREQIVPRLSADVAQSPTLEATPSRAALKPALRSSSTGKATRQISSPR